MEKTYLMSQNQDQLNYNNAINQTFTPDGEFGREYIYQAFGRLSPSF